MPRVFFITGTGRGLGHSLAQVFLDAGEYVVATTRTPSSLSFTGTTEENYLPVKLDVTSSADIEAAIDAALNKFKRIDVVVNNAAFGLVGALETLTDAQIRSQFDTNFFPVATITRKALKLMRTQSPPGGTIIQISSMASLLSFPMVGAMCASKWAVESLTEAARQELKPEWGINLISVKLEALDTEAHQKSMVFGEIAVPEYDHMNGEAWVKALADLPLTDPNQAARAVYSVSKMENPPFSVVLGSNVRKMASEKLKRDEAVLAREDLLEIEKASSG